MKINTGEDTRNYLEDELKAVLEWEEDQKDLWFWEKLGRIPFAILDRITPKQVHKVIGKVLDEMGAYIQNGGQYLIRKEPVLNKIAEQLGRPKGSLQLEEVADIPLPVLNTVTESIKTNHVRFATYQGASTGIGGIFTLAADIPLLLGTSLKVIQEMAVAYGYNPLDKKERIFIIQCLQFASSDYVGKRSILKNLSEYHHGVTERETISQIRGWREVFWNYRDNYGWKKLFQIIPIVGILFGAWINKSTIKEVAEAGQMLYRKRRILEKLEKMDATAQEQQTLTISTEPTAELASGDNSTPNNQLEPPATATE
ncbi:hypothetical protein GCM10011571_00720 [Marinithermofilum abyssi]|uniref:EcsC family protein n=1 Tax=Marinithermofilum abyssi TaxID=1571185 RepID=A0A8J2VC81_9BACL|nr:EcsC family protein [Marinithermofilum abyssi]GGE03699.1 hypothetical protein GCM10011571_00720 [Marinithermofilum abyssi]